jgi:hypothetical protein
MGGSYPGNRRVPQEQYKPNGAAFDNNKLGQATAHFVSYGGGNALVLQQPGSGGGAGPAVGAMAIPLAKQPQYVQGKRVQRFVSCRWRLGMEEKKLMVKKYQAFVLHRLLVSHFCTLVFFVHSI